MGTEVLPDYYGTLADMRRVMLGLVALACGLYGQPESGAFRLYKFEQPIGEENYTVSRSSDGAEVQSDFLFTDRGTKVPLKATLKLSSDGAPREFRIAGSTSRSSRIDTSLTPDQTAKTEAPFFTIAGYAPVAIQEALIGYWRSHGRPVRLRMLPAGEVEIAARGGDTFEIAGKRVTLERYSVRGLVWGLETLWMDSDNHLAALVTRDAEFDHFEAVRRGYEPALEKFVSSAARDAMASLVEMTRAIPGRVSGTFAVAGATVIDGTGRAPITNATVLVRDGRIAAVGPSDSIKLPQGTPRIDAAGKFIIPGLWDMHAHYEQVEWGPIYLAAGVTTVRDVGNELEFITAVRDQIRAGTGLGPRMLLAGIVDGDGPMAIGVERVNSPEDAARWVARYHDAGFEQMKIYSSMKLDNLKVVCAEAHKHGMTVTGHIPNDLTIYDGVNAGMDQVNHIQYPLQPLFPAGFDMRKAKPEERLKAAEALDPSSDAGKRLIAFLKDHGTVIDDTMVLFDLTARPDAEPGIANVAPELRQQFAGMALPPERAAFAKTMRRKELDLIGALHRGGVTLVAGTDQAVPGYSVYRELELYVEAGFTPLEALQAATIVPARVMKVDSDRGTVEAGKRADFDILDASPMENISNVREMYRVVANGVLYDPAPLWKAVGFTPPAD